MRNPVTHRWLPSLKKRVAALRWTGGFRLVRHRGALFLLDYRNFVDRQIAFQGGHETAQLDFLLAAMAREGCDFFLDIGANFGLYAILAALAAPAAQVLAFEPDPRSVDQLHANLYLNRLSGRIEVHPVAVSSKPGPLAFELAAASSTGQSRIVAPGEGRSVAAIRLDDLLPLSGKELFAKIDVEGHELAALEGMARLMKENRCFLQVECFAENLPRLEAMMQAAAFRRVGRIRDDHFFANF